MFHFSLIPCAIFDCEKTETVFDLKMKNKPLVFADEFDFS